MYFVLAKGNKKNYKVVAIVGKDDEITIAKTEHIGYATDIARMFDESFESKGIKTIIEVR